MRPLLSVSLPPSLAPSQRESRGHHALLRLGTADKAFLVCFPVLLQPMREEPPAGVKCKDKFLVQSALITSDKEVLSLPEVVSAASSAVVQCSTARSLT